MKKIQVFIHIPKTGGSTVNLHLTRILGKNGYYHAAVDPYRRGIPFKDRSEEEQKSFIMAGGHFYGEEMGALKMIQSMFEIDYFTTIRDPAERMVSNYNWERRAKPRPQNIEKDFMEYLEKRKNMYTRTYGKIESESGDAFDKAKSFLNRCYFIACTKSLTADFSVFCRSLGLDDNIKTENVSKFKILTLTQEIKQRVYETNQEDVKLYEYALERRSQILKNFEEPCKDSN